MSDQDPEFLQELIEIFAVEAKELIAQLTHDLLAFEKSNDDMDRRRLLDEIFRHAHTLKGSADAVNLTRVKLVAHQLETLFEAVRRGEIALSPKAVDVVLEAVDAMDALIGLGEAGSSSNDVENLVSRVAMLTKEATTDGLGRMSADGGRATESLTGSSAPNGKESPRDSPSPQEESRPRAETPPERGETMRISSSRLDSVLAQVGELIVTASGSEEQLRRLWRIIRELKAWESSWRETRLGRGKSKGGTTTDGNHQLAAMLKDADKRLSSMSQDLEDLARNLGWHGRVMSLALRDLEGDLREARMHPIASAFEGLSRTVRELARSVEKDVRLEVHGADTRLDRVVLEQIKAPLLHLVRNAIAHGIENPKVRNALGKSKEGLIKVGATQRGNTVVIEVEDDGAGIDEAGLIAEAIERGQATAAEAESLHGRAALELLFRPGFSLSSTITDLSGRGVGLDVVRENVEALHGSVEVQTSPGAGTKFTISLPLTITTTRCVLVRSAGQSFAMPLAAVVRSLRLNPHEIRIIDGRETTRINDQLVKLVPLSHFIGVDSSRAGETHATALIVRSGERQIALVVEEIRGIHEIVVKPIPPPLTDINPFAGAAILGSGEIVAVLHPADISSAAQTPRSETIRQDDNARTRNPVVMVVDDSMTTRTLEKNILEAAGYEVIVAVDGVDAWTQLQTEKIDLVVSDVAMPRMDGFELTAKIRSDRRLQETPVLLVTSLDSPSDRERGVSVGADAYVVKGAFDQEHLLKTVRRLI